MGGSWGDRYCAGNQDFVVGANAQQQAVQIEGGDLKNCLALGVEVYRDQLVQLRIQTWQHHVQNVKNRIHTGGSACPTGHHGPQDRQHFSVSAWHVKSKHCLGSSIGCDGSWWDVTVGWWGFSKNPSPDQTFERIGWKGCQPKTSALVLKTLRSARILNRWFRWWWWWWFCTRNIKKHP